MRERDMRLRVERFLQSRLRSMLLPATMGLGLAVGGCASDGLNADDGGDKEDVVAATDTVATKYMAPTTDAAPIPVPVYSVAVPRDAGPELPIAQPEYMAPIKEDAGMVLRYMAQMPDAGRDAGEMVALYLAQIPDPQT
jgi:hypothetical protein